MTNDEWNEWEVAYWRQLAIGKNWLPWWIGWRLWPLVFMGSDEMQRRTIVIGPLVFPLWQCRCEYCKTDNAVYEAILDKEEP